MIWWEWLNESESFQVVIGWLVVGSFVLYSGMQNLFLYLLGGSVK